MMDRMTVLMQDARTEVWRDCGRIVIQELNRRYCTLNLPGMYFTALAGVLEVSSGIVSYCQAGNPNLICFQPGSGWREMPDSGYPVGLLESAEYALCEIRLRPGEMLLAVSDGLLRPRRHDPAGSLELLRTLADSPAQSEQVMRRLHDLADQVSGVERDDQSALLVSYASTSHV
jgi:sigma-B regulation protein RsbU (phosphoserine phosphatase)